MITARDVVLGLYSAWRFFLFDRTGLQTIDGTIDGFWKSFYAAVVALPAAFVLRLLFVQNNPELLEAAGAGRIALVFALDYVYQWVLFPLVMVYMADTMGRNREYVAFIVARNWSQVIQVAIVLPAAVIFIAGDSENPGLAPLVLVVAHIVTWVYAWFIARTALDITGIAAALIVLVELAISVGVSFVSEGLIAFSQPPT